MANTTKEDILLQLHEEYINQITESGLPLWLTDLYKQVYGHKEPDTYSLTWKDELGHVIQQTCEAASMYEAMAYIENQAMQFGHKQCNFVRVELFEHDPDHPLPQDTWDGDLPF